MRLSSGWCVLVRLGGICPLNMGRGGRDRHSILTDGGATGRCSRFSKPGKPRSISEDCWTGRCNVDSTVVRAHQHAAGGKRGSSRARPQPRRVRYENPFAHWIARATRSSLRSPAARKHDAPQLVRLVDAGEIMGVRAAAARGWQAYSVWPATKATTARRHEPHSAGAASSQSFPGVPTGYATTTFDKAFRYRERNVIERCINRLKQWRRVATRYEKLAANYVAVIPTRRKHTFCGPARFENTP